MIGTTGEHVLIGVVIFEGQEAFYVLISSKHSTGQ